MNGIKVMTCARAGRGITSMQGKYVVLSGSGYGTGTGREKNTRTRNENRLEENAADGSVKRAAGRAGCRSLHNRRRRSGSGNDRPVRRSGESKRARVSAAFPLIRGIVFCMVFVCMVTGFGMMIRASSRPKERLWKYYTTVQTSYEHDLDDIVREKMNVTAYSSVDEYVREVCEINSLPYKKGTMPELKPGSMIVVPYHSPELK